MGKMEKLTNSIKNQTKKEANGMKKVLISLGLAMVLVMAVVAPVMALEGTQTASVTVDSYISSTITDAGSAGMNFGSLNPGTSDNAEIDQNGIGAINITVAAETNVVTKIGMKGKGDFGVQVTTGTATGGSTTTVIDTTTNFTIAGVSVGDTVVVREGTATAETATITSISQTTNPDDTLNFDAITTAVAAADAYRVLSDSFVIGQATWDDNQAGSSKTAMTTTYAEIVAATTPGAETSQEVWHWISIPSGQTAGAYTTTFYYKADISL